MRGLWWVAWLTSAFLYLPSCLGAQIYPVIRPLDATFTVPDVHAADVSLVIDSQDGSPVYRLQCHSAGYSRDPDFDYSGDFECRLSTVGDRDRYSTLLTEDPDQSRDWESRARFFASDLKGRCALIPEFGATRTFRLRGMKLTLRIVNPRFTADGALASLELRVAVRPDATAHRSIAEVTALPVQSEPECKVHQYFVDPSKFHRG